MNKKILTLSILIFILSAFTSKQIFSAEQTKEMLVKKKVDFAIERIYSERCACELQGIDAIYVNKIIFKISNKAGTAEDAEIILAFYDIFNNKNRTIVKREKALNPGETRMITMMPRSALMLKSIGITGVVTPRYKNFVEDINEANDKMTIQECIKK